MLLKRVNINEDNIKVNKKKFSHKWSKYSSHHSHKCTRRHNNPMNPVIYSIFHLKNGRSFISLMNAGLVIITHKIYLKKLWHQTSYTTHYRISEWKYLTMILLIDLLSMYIRHDPSFSMLIMWGPHMGSYFL